ncbi:hypothetical protein J6590_023295 [Homalodisca vitripennis]|nr:hypothetical protein J6590_023295 [Homalodisca vitripennis]
MSEDIKMSGKRLQSQTKLHDFQNSRSNTKQSQPHSAPKFPKALVERRILEEQCNGSRKEIQLKGVQEQLQFLCEQDAQLPEVLGKDKIELRPATVIDHKLTKLQLQCLSDEELKMFST